MEDKGHNHNQNEKKGRPLNSYARYSGIAIQMMAIIVIGTFIGVKLDEHYPNEHKLFTISLSLTAVIVSIVVVIRRIIAISKENQQ